jgi:Thiopurine S-methyltransferase (TPMT)
MTSDHVKASVTEARARLQGHFQEYSGDKYGEGWEKLWSKGDFLPWDKGAPNPALVDALEERQDLLGSAMIEEEGKMRRKRALVPGCGRGVDVLLLSSFGYDAVGLEYSETAIKACHQFQKEHGSEYPMRDEQIGSGTAKFAVGDFFKDDWIGGSAGPENKFDLIYDYTVSQCCLAILIFTYATGLVLLCAESVSSATMGRADDRLTWACTKQQSYLSRVPDLQTTVDRRATFRVASASIFGASPPSRRADPVR